MEIRTSILIIFLGRKHYKMRFDNTPILTFLVFIEFISLVSAQCKHDIRFFDFLTMVTSSSEFKQVEVGEGAGSMVRSITPLQQKDPKTLFNILTMGNKDKSISPGFEVTTENLPQFVLKKQKNTSGFGQDTAHMLSKEFEIYKQISKFLAANDIRELLERYGFELPFASHFECFLHRYNAYKTDVYLVLDYFPFNLNFCQGPSIINTKYQEFWWKKPSKRLKIYAEMAFALHLLHESGISHNDIKPDAFVISSDWHAKLIDFDGSAPLNEVSSGGALPMHDYQRYINKKKYLKDPISFDAKIDKSDENKHDIWAFALTIYLLETVNEAPLNKPPSECRIEEFTFETVGNKSVQPSLSPETDHFPNCKIFFEAIRNEALNPKWIAIRKLDGLLLSETTQLPARSFDELLSQMLQVERSNRVITAEQVSNVLYALCSLPDHSENESEIETSLFGETNDKLQILEKLSNIKCVDEREEAKQFEKELDEFLFDNSEFIQNPPEKDFIRQHKRKAII